MFFTLTASRNENPVSLLIQRWRAWRESRATLAGLNSCGGSEVARMARDLSVTTDDLWVLARKGRDASSHLYRRMADLGIDRAAVAASDPMTLRDMQRDCSLCHNKRRCRHDLARAADPSTWASYCPNDQALKMLPGGGARRGLGAVTVTVHQDENRAIHASLIGLLLIGLVWVVLLAGDPIGLRRYSDLVLAPAAVEAPRVEAVTCLDTSCLDEQQLSALQELRAVQSQGWVASSAGQLAILPQSSRVAQQVQTGEGLVCARQGGMTYYGLLFQRGCTDGGRQAAKLDGYGQCRALAGGGVCLSR